MNCHMYCKVLVQSHCFNKLFAVTLSCQAIQASYIYSNRLWAQAPSSVSLKKNKHFPIFVAVMAKLKSTTVFISLNGSNYPN